MRILHVSASDVSGGAGRAAFRLHAGLRRLGIDSAMLVGEKHGDDPQVLCACESGPGRHWPRQLRHPLWTWSRRRLTRAVPSGAEIFTLDRAPERRLVRDDVAAADVIHLHWIAEFVNLPTALPEWAQRAPLVWTLHDMNPLTGGCHFSGACSRHDTGCEVCPQIRSAAVRRMIRSVWQRKQAVYRQIAPDRLSVVAPSRWLAEMARQSTLLGRFDVSVIPYGVDTSVFRPRDRSAVRREWNLPPQAKVLLFVADALHNRRKGFAKLLEAMKYVNDDRLWLLTIGNGSRELPSGLRHRHLGHVTSDELLSRVYSAADLFVIPSLEDNLPNTVLESLACGTPVVGFDTGGIPDMVRDGETGVVVPCGDERALARAIRQLLADESSRLSMSAAARRVAVTEYSLERQAQRYLALYEQLLVRSGVRRAA